MVWQPLRTAIHKKEKKDTKKKREKKHPSFPLTHNMLKMIRCNRWRSIYWKMPYTFMVVTDNDIACYSFLHYSHSNLTLPINVLAILPLAIRMNALWHYQCGRDGDFEEWPRFCGTKWVHAWCNGFSYLETKSKGRRRRPLEKGVQIFMSFLKMPNNIRTVGHMDLNSRVQIII